MTKAPLGKDATDKNPTDRAKLGTKRSLLSDGSGIPLGVVVDGANRHDSKLLAATLDGIVVARPASAEQQPSCQQPQQHLCLDAGYDSESAREEALSRGYEPHFRPSGNAPELRVYVEAATQERAEGLLDWGLEKAQLHTADPTAGANRVKFDDEWQA